MRLDRPKELWVTWRRVHMVCLNPCRRVSSENETLSPACCHHQNRYSSPHLQSLSNGPCPCGLQAGRKYRHVMSDHGNERIGRGAAFMADEPHALCPAENACPKRRGVLRPANGTKALGLASGPAWNGPRSQPAGSQCPPCHVLAVTRNRLVPSLNTGPQPKNGHATTSLSGERWHWPPGPEDTSQAPAKGSRRGSWWRRAAEDHLSQRTRAETRSLCDQRSRGDGASGQRSWKTTSTSSAEEESWLSPQTPVHLENSYIRVKTQ
ncbi:hypothetical protein PAL_GLEAN10003758 [Pteropus alecto]|uniref:Uncharacterized protein n=1 Tax=Pteropus alecto TaxID=9402 RepID=L5L6L6_PTEAL|nr:hypothetical protein PAL_GLEAN10003758 [Pteropus alecto]